MLSVVFSYCYADEVMTTNRKLLEEHFHTSLILCTRMNPIELVLMEVCT